MNEEEFLKKIMNFNKSIFQTSSQLIDSANNILNGNLNIPNLGITLNNKIVEIIHIYQKHNLKLSESFMINLIIRYLLEIVKEAMNDLNNYMQNVCKVLESNDKKKLIELLNKKNDIENNIKDKDNFIFSFDLDKDMHLVVNEEKTYGEGNTKNDVYNRCNKELVMLDFKTIEEQISQNEKEKITK